MHHHNEPGELETDAQELIRRAHAMLVHLAGNPGTEDPQDPSSVQAMPMVLQLPKADAPLRHDLLAAAACACARVCLDPRAGEEDSEWAQSLKDWYGAKIRKLARRARASKWEAVLGLPGHEVNVHGAKAKAFLPGPVHGVDPRINKLQIQGSDLASEPGPLPTPEPDPLHPVIFVDAGLGMTVGKAAAQVGHGSMLYAAFLSSEQAVEWFELGCPVHVREIPAEEFAAKRAALTERHAADPAAASSRWITAVGGQWPVVEVRDAGHTEIAAGSATVIAASYGGQQPPR